jgi:Ca-activated chloride channel homolog
MRTQVRIAALAVALAAAIGVMSSTPGLAQFKSGIEMVPLTVTVTDRAGRYVPGLTAAAFTIFEDGRPQTLSYFAAVDTPVDLALLLDNSSSMRWDFRRAQDAACGLTRSLRPGDRVALSGIAPDTFNTQALTSDPGRVEQAIRSMEASGSTAIYEGVYVLLREFQRERRAASEARRRAIVLLSDGLDTASHVGADQVLDSVRRGDIVVYVILLDRGLKGAFDREESSASLQARFAMASLARESGGRIFTPQTASELPAIYDTVAHELRNQYLLGYTPARQEGDGSFRRISVGVQHADAVQARTRAGYYAVAQRAARAAARDGR